MATPRRRIRFGLAAVVLVLGCYCSWQPTLGSTVNVTQLRYHDDLDGIVFPGPISRSARAGVSQRKKQIQLAKKMNSIQTVEEFFKFMNVIPTELTYSVDNRFGGMERSSAIKPKPATCQPELTVVPVKENPDPAAVYFPNCIRVKRCGGCCTHEALACQPTASEIRNYQIHVTKVDERYQNSVYKEIVPIEEHTACECDCKIKEKDCHEKQYYDPEECRCVCKNTDEEEKCSRQSDKKYWWPSDCSCRCRHVLESSSCSTGNYFDQNSCSCKSLPFSSSFFNNERRTGYNNYNNNNARQPIDRSKETPPVIVTLDASDPRRKHKEDPEYK